jgi:CxxC-x17-CxxC domain-containing protein
MKPFKPFKRTSKFGRRDTPDTGRDDRKPFKKFDRSPSERFSRDSDRPRTFGTKESRSGNGFKLHEAICDKCGNKCDLPFEPTGNKPIYCRSCFRGTKSESGSGSFEPRRFNDRKNDRYEDKQESNMPSASSDELEQINRKLDKIMKALKIN